MDGPPVGHRGPGLEGVVGQALVAVGVQHQLGAQGVAGEAFGLMGRDEAVPAAVRDQWITAARARWAAARAEALAGGGDGGAWLQGDAVRAVTCDVLAVPVVTGDVDPGVLDDLVQLCMRLGRHGDCAADPEPPTAHAREMLERQVIGKARPGRSAGPLPSIDGATRSCEQRPGLPARSRWRVRW
jgi:hypothetical protein